MTCLGKNSNEYKRLLEVIKLLEAFLFTAESC